jgi:ribonuclease E
MINKTELNGAVIVTFEQMTDTEKMILDTIDKYLAGEDIQPAKPKRGRPKKKVEEPVEETAPAEVEATEAVEPVTETAEPVAVAEEKAESIPVVETPAEEVRETVIEAEKAEEPEPVKEEVVEHTESKPDFSFFFASKKKKSSPTPVKTEVKAEPVKEAAEVKPVEKPVAPVVEEKTEPVQENKPAESKPDFSSFFASKKKKTAPVPAKKAEPVKEEPVAETSKVKEVNVLLGADGTPLMNVPLDEGDDEDFLHF